MTDAAGLHINTGQAGAPEEAGVEVYPPFFSVILWKLYDGH